MESNKELEFKVMVTFPHLLEKEVKDFNEFYGTNFKIVEIIYDEVPFCKLKVTKYEPSHIFDLGYILALLENKLKEEDESINRLPLNELSTLPASASVPL